MGEGRGEGVRRDAEREKGNTSPPPKGWVRAGREERDGAALGDVPGRIFPVLSWGRRGDGEGVEFGRAILADGYGLFR